MMLVILAGLSVIVGLQVMTLMVLYRHEPKVKGSPTIDDAMRHAFAQSGINTDCAQDDAFNVMKTGKLHEVFAHATDKLGQHAIETVGDIKRVLAAVK